MNENSPHNITVTISGTWKIQTLADVLTKYKYDKKTTLIDAVFEFIMRSEEKEADNGKT